MELVLNACRPCSRSYHQAAYILQKLKEVGKTANSMSYCVFTDIFEEAGVRFGAFHGGFGLLTIQGINKPAFYAYQFLNKLGKTELVNADSASWACKNDEGVELLLWDFTNIHPGDSVHNHKYYIQDLPAKSKSKGKVTVSGIPKGIYDMKIYPVGYRSKDAFTSFLEMKKPLNLNREQVTKIKTDNSGAPLYNVSVQVKADGKLTKELYIRESDVFLLDIIRK